MADKEIVIRVENLTADAYASIMLDDFKKQIMRYDGVSLLAEKKLEQKGEKCDLTCLAEFAVAVSAGIVASGIIELAKAVYAHCTHPKDYKWELRVETERPIKVTVYKENGVISVDVRDADQKGD